MSSGQPMEIWPRCGNGFGLFKEELSHQGNTH